MSLDLAAIRTAHDRIRPHIGRTPALRSDWLDAIGGGQLWFKCENLQHIGAFKVRGAANAIFALSATDAARGAFSTRSAETAPRLTASSPSAPEPA